MAELHSSGNVPARPTLITSASTGNVVSFDAAEMREMYYVLIATGLDPSDGPAIAKLLSIGAALKDLSSEENQIPFDPLLDGTPVMHALNGEPFPGFSNSSEWYPAIPAGTFDAGLARVAGFETEDEDAEQTLSLMGEADRSNMCARMLSTIVAAIRDNFSVEEASYETRATLVRCFRAGWAMASEHAFTEMLNREVVAKGGSR